MADAEVSIAKGRANFISDVGITLSKFIKWNTMSIVHN
ncbi:hypothetical protein ADIMK_0435 [Marinobacterium lacunae]|uniref:Uncharacterized protein n=1 Tax=Marinobacterium lacunae TaxID=1232683 RepID=A0A081G3X3_9GAMM|nr:hypothetical protein ADIMK_0435 [Marinobacterium lacunae]